jgi:amino acid permease
MLSEWLPAFRSREERGPHIFLTAVFVVLTFSIALSVSELGLLFSIIGATGSNLMTYILPGLFYWKLAAADGNTKTRLLALAVSVLGGIILVLALTVIILDKTEQI